MPKLSVETLTKERVRDAARQSSYEQGCQLFKAGKVEIKEIGDLYAACIVRDYQAFLVEISVSDKFLYLKCNCEDASLGLICEHDVAASLAVHEHLNRQQPPAWRVQVRQVMQATQPATRRSSAQSYLLFFSLQNLPARLQPAWKILPYLLPLNALPPDILSGAKTAPNEDLLRFIEISRDLPLRLIKPTQPVSAFSCGNSSPEEVAVANMLLERSRAYTFSDSSYPISDYLALIAKSNALFLGSPANPLEKKLQMINSTGQLSLNLTQVAGGLCLYANIKAGEEVLPLQNGNVSQQIHIICINPCWLLMKERLLQVENLLHPELLTTWLEHPEILIPASDETEFFEKYYLPLAAELPLQGDGISWEFIETEPVKRLYLSDAHGELKVELRFAYGSFELGYEKYIPSESILRQPDSLNLVRVKRVSSLETSAIQTLASPAYGLKRSSLEPGIYGLRARLHPLDFLLHTVPQLTKEGFEVYGEENLNLGRANRNQPRLSFAISSGIDWFDIRIQVNYGETHVSMNDLRRAIRKNQRYIKLADGTVGEIPMEWIERYQQLFVMGEEIDDSLRMGRHHLALVDELLSTAENDTQVSTDIGFNRWRQSIRSLITQGEIPPQPLPDGFSGELRPYQKAGFDWLHFLNQAGFGGCLADDMGLGKTIQTLVFLRSLYPGESAQSQHNASLLVVPRSLLVNWQREAERFTPGLRVLAYFESSRPKDTSLFEQYDLVITTYGILLRDVDTLRQYTFQHIILDEAQVIKNPLSLTARAARQLRAERRLVLTGTPVENSTMELWSHFTFLNPGLLGNLEYFRNAFATPIEKNADPQAAQRLRRMIHPFILRRTKSQVAPELPPRSERILYCDMEPAQRKLYNRTREQFRGMLLDMIDAGGMQNARMRILEGLLRLRQIANHPRLFEKQFRGGSGKFELLLENLETLRAEGHKTLIFSQFVQMLQLVRTALDERHIPYLYLDGQTRNRQERVDLFQEDPRYPFFLISLKAGGTGLNLTAADYVIHIDPWWNPAVEQQASDRTHRIGQDKPVFIYKLITRDSVEEKIILLQDRKKNLVDQLVTTENNIWKSLSPEDVKILFS